MDHISDANGILWLFAVILAFYLLTVILSQDMEKIFGDDEALDFYTVFYTDAFVCAIRRWILQKDCIPAEEFVNRLNRCLIGVSERIVHKIASKNE